MKYYQVHAYTSVEESHDIETLYEGKSLKKAYRVFEQAKKTYPMVRIDEWNGEYQYGSYDGDYTNDVECWRKSSI